MNDLNRKLNAWAGTDGIDYTDTEIGIAHCVKWLIPKLGEYEITFDDEGSTCIFLGDDPVICYEAIDKDPATALCLAISKVIDNE